MFEGVPEFIKRLESFQTISLP